MKLLCLSDLHGTGILPDITPDLLIVLGDIDYSELRKIDAHYTCPKIGVLGNHDGPNFFEGTNIVNLHKQVMEIQGVSFAGFEGCPKYNKRNDLQYWEDEVQAFTDTLPQVDVFVAHSNPAQIPSFDHTDPHRGFMAFSDYIYDQKPRYMVHGHIHTDKTYTINDTTVVSVYPHAVLTIE